MDQELKHKAIKRALRYLLKSVVLLAIVAGISWFVFFRTADKHANTASTKTTSTQTSQSKVAGSSTSTAAGKTGATTPTAPTTGKTLADTGPADVAAVFCVSAVAGMLAWQWRLRRATVTR
jgi:cytoskeletal protein RodZ